MKIDNVFDEEQVLDLEDGIENYEYVLQETLKKLKKTKEELEEANDMLQVLEWNAAGEDL